MQGGHECTVFQKRTDMPVLRTTALCLGAPLIRAMKHIHMATALGALGASDMDVSRTMH